MGERCRCYWITHPCDGKPCFMEPVRDCLVGDHARLWREWMTAAAPVSAGLDDEPR